MSEPADGKKHPIRYRRRDMTPLEFFGSLALGVLIAFAIRYFS